MKPKFSSVALSLSAILVASCQAPHGSVAAKPAHSPHAPADHAAAPHVQAAHEAPWTMKKLPDTGQTTHNTDTPGEDSFYSINSPSFKVNGDGTVTDQVTGLQWQQADNGEMSWDSGITFCKSLKLSGKSDWRLPYIQELFSIQNQGKNFPSLDTDVFTKSDAEYWWAIEQRVDRDQFAWATNAGGGAGAHPKNETISSGGKLKYNVRCVRGSELGDSKTPHYTDNGDGTITDHRTGLVWQKAEGLEAATWEEALVYANDLVFAGHDDWRLPNLKELQSISTAYAVKPAIDSTFFPGTASALYWSSTSLLARRGNGGQAWNIDFNYGVVSYNPKVDKLHVRAVRGGTSK